MTSYIIVFFCLWGLFLVSLFMKRYSILIDLFALGIFIFFAGQRFETGNDWLVYKNHYLDLQSHGLFGFVSDGVLVFEPIYALTVWVFGFILDFQNFLLVVAAFNGIVLYRFTKLLEGRFSGVAAIYYSWLYLATQMATIRYSIAISFFMLSLMMFYKRKKFSAFFLAIIGCGYHTFILVFTPLFFLINREFNFRRMLVFLLALGLCSYMLFAALIAGWGDGVIFVTKIALYLSEGTIKSLSPGIMAYIGINFLFIFWVTKKFKDTSELRLVKWSAFYLIFFQIFLWSLPIFWNRVQVIVLTIQACIITRYIFDEQKVIVFLAVLLMSLFVIFRSLSAPAFISYIPYQSYWGEYLLSDHFRSDGEERYLEALEKQQLIN